MRAILIRGVIATLNTTGRGRNHRLLASRYLMWTLSAQSDEQRVGIEGANVGRSG